MLLGTLSLEDQILDTLNQFKLGMRTPTEFLMLKKLLCSPVLKQSILAINIRSSYWDMNPLLLNSVADEITMYKNNKSEAEYMAFIALFKILISTSIQYEEIA